MNNKKIIIGLLLVSLILTMVNFVFAIPLTGRAVEISSSEIVYETCPIVVPPACEKKEQLRPFVNEEGCTDYACIPCPIVVPPSCAEGEELTEFDNNGCPDYKCEPKPKLVCTEGYQWNPNTQECEQIPIVACPVDCVCTGKVVTCPTTQGKPIEVEISTSEGIRSISIEKVAEDSISIKDGLSSVKTSKKLIIEGKKIFLETIKGNKEVKVMPSTASDIAINQLKLKNYDIELKDVGKPVYEITGKKDVKIIGLFKAEMAIKSQINVETGAIEKTEKPWWSFLAKE